MKELRQLQDYCVFVKSNLGTDESASPQDVYGFLICEKQQQNKQFDTLKRDFVANKMYVRKYSELMEMAKRIHMEFIERYAKIKDITDDCAAAESLARP